MRYLKIIKSDTGLYLLCIFKEDQVTLIYSILNRRGTKEPQSTIYIFKSVNGVLVHISTTGLLARALGPDFLGSYFLSLVFMSEVCKLRQVISHGVNEVIKWDNSNKYTSNLMLDTSMCELTNFLFFIARFMQILFYSLLYPEYNWFLIIFLDNILIKKLIQM